MSGDSLFRNATIGGFNKEDVMRYIELLKKSAVENEVHLDRAMKQLAATERRVVSAENKLEKEQANSVRLANEYTKLEERVKEAEAKSAALSKRLSNYENSKSKLAAIEVQLGSLMVEAHMYADKIVETAKQEAKRISEETRQIVAQAKEEISAMSTDFVSTSEEYSKLLNVINTKISDLPTQFDTVSDSVKNDYDSMKFEAELDDIPMPDIETSLVEDAIAPAEEADEISETEPEIEVEIEVAPVSEPVQEQPAQVEESVSEEKSIEDEAMAKLDELFANIDIEPAEFSESDSEETPAEEKVVEEPFSMSSFFSGVLGGEDLKVDEPAPAQEENTSAEETFDYTKFLDFLADDSSN